jgi:hypothetical protein
LLPPATRPAATLIFVIFQVVTAGLASLPSVKPESATSEQVVAISFEPTGSGFTVIVTVAVVAHGPASGVKVYVVVVVLSNAGDQVPVIPLFDVICNADKLAPEQIGATAVNVGVTFGLTVIVTVAVVAHCPASGVKVYVVVIVLSNAGDQVPVIPLVDVVGNADKLAPEQIGDTAVNVGVTFGLTVIVTVAVVAHGPASGVKVYVVVVVLSNAGDQVPVISLVDVVGNADKLAPEHIGATAVNVGVTSGLTVIVTVAVVAHCPASGVKVYVVVVVLSNAGDQLPVIPLVDVVGNADKLAPEQIGATAVNVGVTFGLTVIVTVAVVAHCPASGVKVYVVVVVLSNAGDHVPVIPLVDVVGNADKLVPEHIGATAVNVGVIFGLTVIVNVAVVAH